MHSLETGIVVAIAAFFFLSFLTFTFSREVNISKDIDRMIESEKAEYKEAGSRKYKPELLNNIIDIIVEGEKEDVGEDNE